VTISAAVAMRVAPSSKLALGAAKVKPPQPPPAPPLSRTEDRDGVETTVLYAVRESGGAGGGWGGFTFAAPSASFELGATRIATAALIVTVAGLLIIFVLIALVAMFAARRLSRPIIATQRALDTIAKGDYSVRVAVDRTDEIGELQRLVNHVAEELRRREQMKDMMGKYMSKQVAEHVMANAAELALGGVRREVSVLFADVRGFTSYSEKHSAEDVTRSLNEYFQVVVGVIAAHEGVLDKFIGDGIMVVFGAPAPQPDHALRAVLTGLEMQAGVNTGIVVSGNLGSIERMEFTVIGDTVNLAARLEGRAAQGQVLIGQNTYDKVKDRVLAEHLGALPVKGKQAPVEIWLVKGIRIPPPQGGGTQ